MALLSRSSSSSSSRSLPLILLILFVLSPLSRGYTELFDSWCRRHGKSYTTEEEKMVRFRAFEENRAFVERHNAAGKSSYAVELNAFADLGAEEFRAARLGLAPRIASPLSMDRTVFQGFGGDVPDSLDWRKKGAVTGVKDQGSCGACWSFSATGAIEGVNQIVTGSLVSLSEQELVDCDQSSGNTGCNGGLMDYAFQWVIKNKGIDTENDYPYKARDSSCIKNKENKRVVTIDGYTDVPSSDEKLLLQAVAKQPVSVGICGSDRSFQLYSKGIFTGPCSTSLDHAVLIVGYGSENGVDYWILKNSWGTKWGIDGYMHMLRNGGSKQGVCGINMLPSYPTKSSTNPPPSPGPGPTKCSLTRSCPEGSTCCCTWKFLGYCLSWSCCELESAVCCKDHRYCCPSDYPICDTKNGQCLKASGNSTGIEGMQRKRAFLRAGSWNALLEAWVL